MTITYFLKSDSGFTTFVNKWLSMSDAPGVWIYVVLYVVLTVFFTYFYTAVTFNVVDVSDNMRSNGGFIPGIRPGRTTVEYLNRVMTRITFVGAVFLAAIAALPFLIQQATELDIRFGGTALLIVVGVGLDTMKQIENQMVMRNYRGFL
jgi:preprotein translocase subunit SecY